jgi:CheY-like chemotaxis protein
LDEARWRIEEEAPAIVVLEPYQGSPAGVADLDAAWVFVRWVLSLEPRISVVLCSVLDERRVAYALGASLCLLKPVAPQALVAELQRLLNASATTLRT